MKTLELFCGTKSFSKVAENMGMETFTIDIDYQVSPDIITDIRLIDFGVFNYRPDIIWASPPCQCFSVASIGTHWKENYQPKTEKAVNAISLVIKTIQVIQILNPKYWFIENPRGMLRKLMPDKYHRKTVTYCQYGDTRMKPTDIWTNLESWNPKPMCKNGSPCHISAPRGSRTGTQGLKNAKERGRIPSALFEEIFKVITNKE